MNRPDFFCEDYREFGDALGDMAKEAKLLALWEAIGIVSLQLRLNLLPSTADCCWDREPEVGHAYRLCPCLNTRPKP